MLVVIIVLLIFIECLPDAVYTLPGDTKMITINNADSALNVFSQLERAKTQAFVNQSNTF